MAKKALVAAIVAAFLSLDVLSGHAQQIPRDKSQDFDSPFQRESKELRHLEDLEPLESPNRRRSGGVNKQLLGAAKAARPENRLTVLFGNDVKKLLQDHPTDDKVRSLKKERCRAAFVAVEAELDAYRAGQKPIHLVLKSSARLASSLLALEPDPSTRIAILKHNVEVAREVEKNAQLNLRGGTGTVQDTAHAKYERLSAEILLEEAKRKSQPKDSDVWVSSDTVIDERRIKPEFVVYSSKENARLSSSLYHALLGRDLAAQIEKANTLQEAAKSDAEVIVLVMPDRWQQPVEPAVVEAFKNRKIVGIGYGAGKIFAALGQEITSDSCAHFSLRAPRLNLTNSKLLGDPEWNAPVPVFNKDGEEQFMALERRQRPDVFAMHLPTSSDDAKHVDAIARFERHPNYAPIVRQGNYILIGLPIHASQWSEEYGTVVRDVFAAHHNRESEDFSIVQRKLSQQGIYDFELAASNSTEKPSSRNFWFKFGEPTLFSAKLHHAGSRSVMMLFMGEDGKRNNWTREDAKNGQSLNISVEVKASDLEQVGAGYWRLTVTNFGGSPAKCRLALKTKRPE